ncbi:MAG: hypothetical protein MH204_07080 [Fimbriimonadaceae bacterium]|nr:hypothetical protein [Fimbriimonadaceae bacterium]
MISVLLAAAVAQSADSVSLQWKPKAGETFTYEYTLDQKVGRMTAFIQWKVLQSEPDGWTIQTTSRGALVQVAGQEIRDSRTTQTMARYGIRGQLLDILQGPQDRGAVALARVNRFVAPPQPVRPGGTWRFEYPAESGLPALRLDFTLREVKGSPRIARVAVRAAEEGSGMTADGEWEIGADGAPLGLKATVRSLPGLPSGDSFSLSLTRR